MAHAVWKWRFNKSKQIQEIGVNEEKWFICIRASYGSCHWLAIIVTCKVLQNWSQSQNSKEDCRLNGKDRGTYFTAVIQIRKIFHFLLQMERAHIWMQGVRGWLKCKDSFMSCMHNAALMNMLQWCTRKGGGASAQLIPSCRKCRGHWREHCCRIHAPHSEHVSFAFTFILNKCRIISYGTRTTGDRCLVTTFCLCWHSLLINCKCEIYSII